MPFIIKMFKKMLLQTSLTSRIFSVITFIIVPTVSETICGTTNTLLKTGLRCQKIYQAFVFTVKAVLILYDVWVTVLINVSVSETLRHNLHLLPLYLQNPVFLSIE